MKPTFYIDSEIKDIKVGQKYNFTLLAIHDKTECMDALFESPTGMRYFIKQNDYVALSLENGTKNTETTPKYDLCRKFRKGDIVRLREYNGRKPYDFWYKQVIKNYEAELDTVLEDELDSGNVDIFQDAPIDELTARVHSCHLELVTPVEELEPYSVHESEVIQGFDIVRDKLCVMTFPFGEKENGWYYNRIAALVTAEDECARLNAEYRKEKI